MNQLGYSLILTNEDDEEIDLYDNPDLALTSSDGFGTNVEVSTTSNAGTDGALYQSTYVPARELSFTVQYLNDSINPEIAKIKLHNVLKIKQKIKVHYISPNRDCYIYGYIKTVDTPENTYPMVTQITMICPDPYWRSTDSQRITVEVQNGEAEIDYDGDTPIGFITTIRLQQSFTGFNIKVNDENFEIYTRYASQYNSSVKDTLDSGSAIIVDSIYGEKSVKYYSDGDTTKNGTQYFAATSVACLYPTIKKGKNKIKITGYNGTSYSPALGDITTGFTCTIEYSEMYLGGI